MTDVVNPKSASPDQLLPYHKKISAEGKALNEMLYLLHLYGTKKQDTFSDFLLGCVAGGQRVFNYILY